MLIRNVFMNQGTGSGVNMPVNDGQTFSAGSANNVVPPTVPNDNGNPPVNTDVPPVDTNTGNSNAGTNTPPATPDTNTPPVNTPVDFGKIEIDGATYNLDKEGNALKEDGSIFLDKTKIDEFSNDVSIFEEIEKTTGFVITDDKGNKVIYDNTPAGLAKREQDVIEIVRAQAKQELEQTIFENNPDIRGMYEYKQKYGTLDGFGTVVDYTKVKFEEGNVDLLKQLVVERELSIGKSRDTAKAYADYLEKNNQLVPQAKESLQVMKQNQIAIETERAVKIKESNDNIYGVELNKDGKLVDLNKPGSYYDTIIKTGEFNGLKIPETGITVKEAEGKAIKWSKEDFFKYMAFNVENGYSQADIDIEKFISTPKNRATLALFIKKGGDLSELTANAIKQHEVKRITTIKQNTITRGGQSTTSQASSANAKRVSFPINS